MSVDRPSRDLGELTGVIGAAREALESVEAAIEKVTGSTWMYDALSYA